MDRYLVIGNPVAHSQSPFIHAAFAAQTGQRMEYGRRLCPPGGFDSVLQAFATEGGRGCNVTTPFKFDAFRSARARTPRAALAGACNTLRLDADGWLGDNTDGAGLLEDIEGNAGITLRGRRVLLLGAGGAAAGVLGPLVAARPAEVVVANRTLERAVALLAQHRTAADAAQAGAGAGVRPGDANVELRAAPLEDCGEAYDVVVNATASSLQAGALPIGPRVLGRGALAIDLMYGAAAQPFVRWAERHGAVGRDGLGMLVEQAAIAFELFRGVRPETPPVLAALRRRLADDAQG